MDLVWRSLLAALGVAALGCSSAVYVTGEPGDCSEDRVAYVYRLYGTEHAPLTELDYPERLCDGRDGELLGEAARRRMGRRNSHYAVGLALADLDQTALAIAAFRRDLAGATTLAARIAARVEIASLLSEAGEHEAALRELDACDEELAGERWWNVRLARVDVLVAAGRRREAIELLEPRTTTRHGYTNMVTHVRIAELWLEEGEPERAREAYEAALKQREGHRIDTEVFEIRVGFARVLHAQGRPDEALALLDGMLHEIDEDDYWPDHEEAWRLRAELQLELGKPLNAAASIRRAFEIEHRWTEPSALAKAGLQSELASLYRRADRPELAFASFKAAHETFARELGSTDRRTIIAAHNAGVACLDLEDPELALSWLQLAADLHERARLDAYDRGLTLLNLARTHKQLGRHADAARSFAIALELLGELDDPRISPKDRARMVRDAGRAFIDLDDCARATATIERAQQLYAQLGDERTFMDLTNSRRQLAQLRVCIEGDGRIH